MRFINLQPKRQSLVGGPAFFGRRIGGLSSFALFIEALPFGVPLNSASVTGDASVNKVSEYNKRQCQSDQRAPSLFLPGYIYSRIASQMFIFIIASKVGFSSINMPFISIIKVILSFVFSHFITF